MARMEPTDNNLKKMSQLFQIEVVLSRNNPEAICVVFQSFQIESFNIFLSEIQVLCM